MTGDHQRFDDTITLRYPQTRFANRLHSCRLWARPTSALDVEEEGINPAMKRHLQWASNFALPLIRCFNLAELCLLVALPIGLGQQPTSSTKSATSRHRHQCRNFTRGPQGLHRRRFANCVARHATGIQKDDTQAGKPRKSPTRSRRLGCELRKGRCCRARHACVGCSRPIPDQMAYLAFSRSI